MRNSRILSIGRCVPERVVTNDDLTKLMDTSDDWIQQRTGIRERHIASDNRAVRPRVIGANWVVGVRRIVVRVIDGIDQDDMLRQW